MRLLWNNIRWLFGVYYVPYYTSNYPFLFLSLVLSTISNIRDFKLLKTVVMATVTENKLKQNS